MPDAVQNFLDDFSWTRGNTVFNLAQNRYRSAISPQLANILSEGKGPPIGCPRLRFAKPAAIGSGNIGLPEPASLSSTTTRAGLARHGFPTSSPLQNYDRQGNVLACQHPGEAGIMGFE